MARGPQARPFVIGQRIGIPGGTGCGHCAFCAWTGRTCATTRSSPATTVTGLRAIRVRDSRFCFALPDRYDDAHAAPLLCAGLIGYRAWRLAGAATPHRLGLYGFGAAAHITGQIAVARGQEVYAFTRPGDSAGQAFARSLGAAWPADPMRRHRSRSMQR